MVEKVKTPVTKTDNLSSISEYHIEERQNRLPWIAFWHLQTHNGMYVTTHNKYINIMKMIIRSWSDGLVYCSLLLQKAMLGYQHP